MACLKSLPGLFLSQGGLLLPFLWLVEPLWAGFGFTQLPANPYHLIGITLCPAWAFYSAQSGLLDSGGLLLTLTFQSGAAWMGWRMGLRALSCPEYDHARYRVTRSAVAERPAPVDHGRCGSAAGQLRIPDGMNPVFCRELHCAWWRTWTRGLCLFGLGMGAGLLVTASVNGNPGGTFAGNPSIVMGLALLVVPPYVAPFIARDRTQGTFSALRLTIQRGTDIFVGKLGALLVALLVPLSGMMLGSSLTLWGNTDAPITLAAFAHAWVGLALSLLYLTGYLLATAVQKDARVESLFLAYVGGSFLLITMPGLLVATARIPTLNLDPFWVDLAAHASPLTAQALDAPLRYRAAVYLPIIAMLFLVARNRFLRLLTSPEEWTPQ
jgi:hypothetical protein